MARKKVVIPHVPMRMEQVDGGRAVIGLIDCGERTVFCGTKNKKSERPDGRSRVVITQIF